MKKRNRLLAVILLLLSLTAFGCTASTSDGNDAGGNNVANNNTNTNTNTNNPNTNNPNTNTNNPNTTTGCVVHSDCAVADNNDICSKGECVSPIKGECFAIEGNINAENVVVIGSILPTQGDYASIGIPIENAIRMAIREINDGGGLGGGRKLALLGCDSSGDVDKGRAAATHLTETMGVSTIIGPAFSGIYIEVSDSITTPSSTLIMSPSATAPSISYLDDNNLSWRTVPSDVFQGVAISDRIRDFKDALGTDIKVIAFAKDDAYGNGLLGKVTDELGVDLGSSNFLGVTYQSDISTSVIEAIVSMPDADFVLLLGTNELVDILDLYETVSISEGNNLPKYVISDGGQVPEMITLIEENPALIARIEGVLPDGKNGSRYTSYNLRYKSHFNEDAGIYSANAYDAMYVLAYSMMSLGADGEITGTTLSDAIINGKITQGTKTEPGPNNVGNARNTLLAGNSIDYEGASGPIQFDTSTGDVSSNVTLWVIEGSDGNFDFQDTLTYKIGADGTGTWGPLED